MSLRPALLSILGIAMACGGPQTTAHRPPSTGAVIGLVRDRASGEPIAMAELRLRLDGELGAAIRARSEPSGTYEIDGLQPGRYTLTTYYAGDVVEVANIGVSAGRTTPVDVAFELGRTEPLRVDYGDASDGAIDRYRPRRGDPATGLIEGTVSDSATRERVPGAVVTALGHELTDTRQTVTDGQGRFLFEDLPPGTYAVSAYYTVQRRGQIEVLRNGLEVRGGAAVVVPLWVELVQ
jgi:hypothetical protein